MKIDIADIASLSSMKEEEPPIYETGNDSDEKPSRKAQLEDGFFKIAALLADNFQQTTLSSNESKVVWCVLRKTYGWHKKEDRISGSQFKEGTKLHPVKASAALNSLIDRGILYRRGGKFGPIGINTKVDQWKLGKIDRSENLTKTVKFSENLTKTVKKNLTKTVKHKRYLNIEKNNMSGKPDDAAKSNQKKTEETVNRYCRWKDENIPMKERWKDAPKVGRAYLIIEYLNAGTNRHFQALHPDDSPNSNAKLIFTLFSKGYTGDQICNVIDDRIAKWGSDAKMREFIRPITLFRLSNFVQYNGQLEECK